LIENEQTKARSLSTQALLSRYPWASKVDKEILLFGFRMGEQFARRTAGFHWDTEACAQAAHSTSEARQFYAAPSSSAIDQT
jgi:hypothetical protein